MNTTKLLEDARALITDEAKWARGAYARDAHGNPIDATNPLATCFCSTGAVLRAHVNTGEPDLVDEVGYRQFHPRVLESWEFLNLSVSDIDPPSISIVNYNDNHATHAQVLKVFDDAIARSKDLT